MYMKYFFKHINLLFVGLTFIVFSCNDNAISKKNVSIQCIPYNPKASSKPPSNYEDTLVIDFAAAVFYYPDSLQLLAIKKITDPGVFESSMHEYFYQIRTAQISIKKNWPKLKIIEAKNYRYIFFNKQDNARNCIDLNTKSDAYGLFLFEPHKIPLLIDMTNAETEVSFYMNNK